MDLRPVIDSIWEATQKGIYFPVEWRGRLTVDDGYRVQLGMLDRYVKDGEQHSGWKVGLTAKSIQNQVGHHEPVFGFLLESGERPSGTVFDFAELVSPCFENELCVLLGETLKGPNVTVEQARRAIEAVTPAIEVVEKRGDFSSDSGLAMADNVQQKYYVTGPETRPLPPDTPLSHVTVEVFINGESVGRAGGDAVLGEPAAAVAWLANKLATFGRRLHRGQQIMSGSFTRQFPIAQGDHIEAVFNPFGSVSAEFQ